jgi:hypothetical protein
MRVLERGRKAFPNDGEITFYLGFLHYHELLGFIPEDPDDPETKYHQDLGRRLIGQSALMPNAPPYATQHALGLLRKSGAKEMVVAHLRALLAKETEPKIREKIIKDLKRELGEAAKRDIEDTERLQRKWRKDMPYIPLDLYVLLKPEFTFQEMQNPLAPFDRILGLREDTPEHPDTSLAD